MISLLYSPLKERYREANIRIFWYSHLSGDSSAC